MRAVTMPSDDDGEREMPPDQQRKHVRTIEPVKGYLRERAEEEGVTMSVYLDGCLPEDAEPHDYEDEITHLKVVPDVHAVVKRLAGANVDDGEVVAYYLLLDALDRGDMEAAAEIAEYAPEQLLEALRGQ